MNSDLSNCSSSTIDSIRRAGVGRRGGVRVRGGRLPPVQIHKALAKSKVIAPKIVERKVKVKTEEKGPVTDSYIKKEFQDNRGRGRGRGRAARTYIQTEGTFLGDGPGQKLLKREKDFSGYERPLRSSNSSGMKSEVTSIDVKSIDVLLESYDQENDSESDGELKPIKFPFVKEQKAIKKEKTKPEEDKLVIKEEAEDGSYPKVSLETLEGKFFTRIKSEPLSDDEVSMNGAKKNKGLELPDMKGNLSDYFKNKLSLSTEREDLLEDIKKMEREGLLMLLQFPSCLPFDTSQDETENLDSKPISKNDVRKDDKEIFKPASIKELPEGVIGKFQILKSGKMRFVMGSTHIYLEKSSSQEYFSEVVSIPVNKHEGDVIVVGNINRKMILKPHISGVTN